jgi:hypothetical protein
MFDLARRLIVRHNDRWVAYELIAAHPGYGPHSGFAASACCTC